MSFGRGMPIGGLGTAPIGGRETAPIGGRGIAPIGGRGNAPIGGRGTATIAGRGTATIGGREITPIGGRETTPIGGLETTPIGGRGTSPVGGRGIAPIGGRGTTPIGGRGTAPIGGRGTAPIGLGVPLHAAASVGRGVGGLQASGSVGRGVAFAEAHVGTGVPQVTAGGIRGCGLLAPQAAVVSRMVGGRGVSVSPMVSSRGGGIFCVETGPVGSGSQQTAGDANQFCDKTMSTTEHLFSNLSVGDMKVDRGKRGQVVPVASNYIKLTMKKKSIYQYSVHFSPEIDSIRLRKSLLMDHESQLGSTRAFDGAILFLPDEVNVVSFISIRQTDGSKVSISLKLIKVLPTESAVHFFNVLFKRVMNILKLCPVGRSYFNPHDSQSLPKHHIEIWPGYVSSINNFDGGLLLNIDVAHKILRTVTVHQMMKDIVSKCRGSDFKSAIQKELIGSVVMTRYNNRTYRIDDIDWKETPLSSFDKNGVKVSFKEYYESSYSLKVVDEKQPLIVHKVKEKFLKLGQPELIYLVPELTHMTGLTDEHIKDFHMMKDIHVHTRVDPQGRRKTINSLCRQINSNEEARASLAVWGIELQDDILTVEGRVLPREEIFFKNNKICCNENADFTSELKSNQVISAVPINNWCILCPERNKSEGQKLMNIMQQVCGKMGIPVKQPKCCVLASDKNEEFVRTLREEINPGLQLVVMIFPTLREDRYSAVKKICCIEAPVASQVILSKNIADEKKVRSVIVKVALQVQAKLGAELWAVNLPPKFEKGLMVVGIDVCHDKTTTGHQSIGAVVCSLNNTCTRWYSTVHKTPELLNNLKLSMEKGLQQYKHANGNLPGHIFVFRDGVGDGDIPNVKSHEVEQLHEVLNSLGTTLPKLVFVIVQKRISCRMFKYAGNMTNPSPGTILDHTITRRGQCNFYLVSQHVRQGTVTPTHYIVIANNSNLSVDVIQGLAYKMTYMYYNWPGTVRVPAPCQYAHKLAGLVGQNLGRPHDKCLNDRLFYL